MEARDLLREQARSFELSLRIRHPSMDPAAISRELRLEPEHCFKAGEPRESSSGIAAATVHAESYWLATLDPISWADVQTIFDMSVAGQPRLPVSSDRVRSLRSVSLGMTLSMVASHFLRSHGDFMRRIQAEGGEVALIVEISGRSVQSFTLTSQIARAIADLGIDIDFELTSD